MILKSAENRKRVEGHIPVDTAHPIALVRVFFLRDKNLPDASDTINF
jgi:hypothetical protein